MQTTMKPKKNVDAQTQNISDKKRPFKNQNLHNKKIISHNYNIIEQPSFLFCV